MRKPTPTLFLPRPFIIYHGKEGEREFRKPSLFVLLLCTSLPNRHVLVLLLPFWFQDAAASLLKVVGGSVGSKKGRLGPPLIRSEVDFLCRRKLIHVFFRPAASRMRKAGCAFFVFFGFFETGHCAKRNAFPFFLPRGGKKRVSQKQGKLLKGLVLVYLQRMGADGKLFFFFFSFLVFFYCPLIARKWGKKKGKASRAAFSLSPQKKER